MKIVIIEPLGITPEKLAEATAAVKARGHEIVAYDTKEEDQDKLAERGKDADIIIIANQPFRKNVIEKCKNLKLLSVAFTGVDHIDVDFCKEKGICVCNAAGYSTNAVAELAFGLAISVLRNIPACDAVCRKEGTKAGLVGCELFGKTFGVVGTGAIGSKVAKIAQAFGCKVVAYSRTVKPEMQGAGIEYLPLEDVLKVSDIVDDFGDGILVETGVDGACHQDFGGKVTAYKTNFFLELTFVGHIGNIKYVVDSFEKFSGCRAGPFGRHHTSAVCAGAGPCPS